MKITNKLRRDLELSKDDIELSSEFPECQIEDMAGSRVLFVKVISYHSFSFSDKADLMEKIANLRIECEPELKELIKLELKK